jgi:hypothetical protein
MSDDEPILETAEPVAFTAEELLTALADSPLAHERRFAVMLLEQRVVARS